MEKSEALSSDFITPVITNTSNDSNIPTTPLINERVPICMPNINESQPKPNLSEKLFQDGWTVEYSNRQRKWYFFNTKTRQSRWEEPQLEVVNNLEDPLGLTSEQNSPSHLAEKHSIESLIGEKRRSSNDIVLNGPTQSKRPTTYLFWDFKYATNVVIHDKAHFFQPPPHPEIEFLRSNLMNKLRLFYEELCQSREGIPAPPESFNRWLLERKLCDEGSDPVLSSKCSNPISESLKREIMNDIPMPLSKPKYTADCRRQLYKYCEAAKRMVEIRANASDNCRKIIKWKVEETFSFLRSNQHASFDDYLERLGHLKRFCHKELKEIANESVDGICRALYEKSCEAAQELHLKHIEILKEGGVPPPYQRPHKPEPKKVWCYPALLSIPCPKMPQIQFVRDNDTVRLTYKNDVQIISVSYFEKLKELYEINCKDDPKNEHGHLLPRVWCLLRRYSTYFGIKKFEGSCLQGALPVKVFECLSRYFKVSFECFASPLNCYYKQFCSAFPDTDGYFGSRGSILDFKPVSGSFEANPPFSEELMISMVDHFEALLAETNEPLSFIVFVPEWRDPPTEALLRLESSRFKTKLLSIPPLKHEYRHGFQHIVPLEEINRKSAHSTLVVFLQNQTGFDTWTPSLERIKELQNAYKPQEFADTFGQQT